jgi:phosphoribosylamine--glycine ligase
VNENSRLKIRQFIFLYAATRFFNNLKRYCTTYILFMNILLLGSGGREHALSVKISQSPLCSQLFIAPGNAGTASCGINLPFTVNDFSSIREACATHHIDMVIVGPEEPLVNGIVDYLKSDDSLPNLQIIGPSKEAAQLEGSKAFAKAFMQRHGIPTAAYREFTADNFNEGLDYLKDHSLPIVLKADGLAAGKGVIICQNHLEAVAEFELMIQRSKFGEAGKRVVVEEFLRGIELSVFVLTDGKDFLVLPEAKDYKQVGEGDTGLNTGGMGAISPVPFADETFMEKVLTRIVTPTISGLLNDKLDYKGFVFVGLMKVGDDPFVIEYNCRLGDPETEVVVPRLNNDLVKLLTDTTQGRLSQAHLDISPFVATTIVAVSGGYPNDYEKGFPVTSIPPQGNRKFIFHMGTKQEDDQVITNGGRVLCATALAPTLEEAIDISADMIREVRFEGKYFRGDIGYEFMEG